MVDVSDPAQPREVGFYDTPGYAEGVAVSGSYIYVADRDGGLVILRFTRAGPTPTPSPTPTGMVTPTGTPVETPTGTPTPIRTPTPGPTAPPPTPQPGRPSIDQVRSCFIGPFYFWGYPLPNRYDAFVDWKGLSPAYVGFVLNGAFSREAASRNPVSHVYNMGFDLRYDPLGARIYMPFDGYVNYFVNMAFRILSPDSSIRILGYFEIRDLIRTPGTLVRKGT